MTLICAIPRILMFPHNFLHARLWSLALPLPSLTLNYNCIWSICSNAFLMCFWGGGWGCFPQQEISICSFSSCFLLKRRTVRKVWFLRSRQVGGARSSKVRCWWSADEEITLLLRFVISDQLPAGGAASSHMTSVASGIVATTTANWKAYTQKCLCLVTLNRHPCCRRRG